MRHDTVDGIVLRTLDRNDHDRYLTVLTAERGRLTLLSKAGGSLKSPQRAVSQLFTYANFEFYRRGDFNILSGGSPIAAFEEIPWDWARYNLASYLCELTLELCDEGEPAEELTRLLLNSFYAITKRNYPYPFVKAAFEWRAAWLSGYAPTLDGCAECGGGEGETVYLDVMNGSLLCSHCLQTHGDTPKTSAAYDEIREAEILLPLSPATLAALRYIANAPIERLFAFSLQDPEDERQLIRTSEIYILSHLGRDFKTLEACKQALQEIKDNV